MNDVAVSDYAPDLAGENYIAMLKRLHEFLRPKTYLEIGVFTGQSLALAQCPAIGIDPFFQIEPRYMSQVVGKPQLHLYQMGSDDFFAATNPATILGARIDMAFLDGMHRCEYLLRDFINTERHCKKNSVIALHDCLPVEHGIASRSQGAARATAPHRKGWWTGDVWRTSLLLKRQRPDLQMTVLDCVPTGLVLISNLDPASTMLSDNYASLAREMLTWELAQIGVENLFSEMQVTPSTALRTHEDITERFWL